MDIPTVDRLKGYITVEAADDILGRSPGHVRYMILTRRIPGVVLFGGAYALPERNVVEFGEQMQARREELERARSERERSNNG